MTAPSKHTLHNILPVLSLKCLTVRICDRDTLPCHCSFTLKWLPTGFEHITLRLSDMTESVLYLHSIDFLATKEDNRSKEYLNVHVELCGHFSEFRMIATEIDSSSSILV